MKKKVLPLAKAYQLLEPGPVIMVTTAYKGKTNVMTMSWHTVMEFVPPLVGCVMGSENYSFNLLKASKECVINIPTVELAQTVVHVGNTSGAKVDKFKLFDIATQPASLVAAPLLSQCYANFECRVVDSSMVRTYNFFILEVVKAWIATTKKGSGPCTIAVTVFLP